MTLMAMLRALWISWSFDDQMMRQVWSVTGADVGMFGDTFNGDILIGGAG